MKNIQFCCNCGEDVEVLIEEEVYTCEDYTEVTKVTRCKKCNDKLECIVFKR